MTKVPSSPVKSGYLEIASRNILVLTLMVAKFGIAVLNNFKPSKLALAQFLVMS